MSQVIISMGKKIGTFAENKETARGLRVNVIMPSLRKGKEVILDFKGVNGTTQSFIHALISEPIREFADVAFDKLLFKDCNESVKKIIDVVYHYMQESLSAELNTGQTEER